MASNASIGRISFLGQMPKKPCEATSPDLSAAAAIRHGPRERRAVLVRILGRSHGRLSGPRNMASAGAMLRNSLLLSANCRNESAGASTPGRYPSFGVLEA